MSTRSVSSIPSVSTTTGNYVSNVGRAFASDSDFPAAATSESKTFMVRNRILGPTSGALSLASAINDIDPVFGTQEPKPQLTGNSHRGMLVNEEFVVAHARQVYLTAKERAPNVPLRLNEDAFVHGMLYSHRLYIAASIPVELRQEIGKFRNITSLDSQFAIDSLAKAVLPSFYTQCARAALGVFNYKGNGNYIALPFAPSDKESPFQSKEKIGPAAKEIYDFKLAAKYLTAVTPINGADIRTTAGLTLYTNEVMQNSISLPSSFDPVQGGRPPDRTPMPVSDVPSPYFRDLGFSEEFWNAFSSFTHELVPYVPMEDPLLTRAKIALPVTIYYSEKADWNRERQVHTSLRVRSCRQANRGQAHYHFPFHWITSGGYVWEMYPDEYKQLVQYNHSILNDVDILHYNLLRTSDSKYT